MELIDKKAVQEAMREAASGGHDIIREFDKVWARINRGEFDVALTSDDVEQTPVSIIQDAIERACREDRDEPFILTNWVVLYEGVESGSMQDVNGVTQSPSCGHFMAPWGSIPAQLGLADMFKDMVYKNVTLGEEDD